MVQTFTLANISDIWSFAAGGLQITATQDVTGVTVAAPSQATTLPCTVVALQGQSITSTAPTSNQALVWNSGTSKWTPTAIVNSFNTRTGSVTLAAADVGAVSSFSAPAHQWITAFSAAGVFSSAQPAFSDISGALASTQLAVGATLAFSGNTLETAALTGDVTTAANSFATTISAIQGTSITGVTGTGNVVFSASPTFTGTITAATLNASTLTLTNALALPNGSTATTQSAGDNSTKVATTAFVEGLVIGGGITGLLPTSITGSNTSAAVTISSGSAVDSTAAAVLKFTGANSWAVSNGNAINGYSGGTTLPNSTTIHFFICAGTSGVGSFASNSLTPAFPTGFTAFSRRIFSLLTNSAGALIAVTPHESSGGSADMGYIAALSALDYAPATIPTASRATVTLTVPTGIIVKAVMNVDIAAPSSGGAGTALWISDLATNDVAPAVGTITPSGMIGIVVTFSDQIAIKMEQWTNTSGQIGVRAATANSSGSIQTIGWIDPRRT